MEAVGKKTHSYLAALLVYSSSSIHLKPLKRILIKHKDQT